MMLQNAKVFVVIVELKTSSPDFFRSPTNFQLGVSKQAIWASLHFFDGEKNTWQANSYLWERVLKHPVWARAL